MMMLESVRPIQTPKAAELVARHLRRYIVDARIVSGTRLPSEAELCARYAVSRTIVREAIRILEAEGLVETVRGSHRGSHICVPGPAIMARPTSLLLAVGRVPVSDVIVACRMVEVGAIERGISDSEEALIPVLRNIVERELPVGYRVGSLAQGAFGFHRALVRASGVESLALVAESLHLILASHAEAVCDGLLREDMDAFGCRYRELRRSYQHMLEVMAARGPEAVADHWSAHWAVLEGALLGGGNDVAVSELVR